MKFMRARRLFSALQGGNLSVLNDVTDFMSEISDCLDMLRGANRLEEIDVIEHLKSLDDEEADDIGDMLGMIKKNDWFF
jgi:hypothetical protein|tara:strand:+ start:787 stop:1023 length:237 start_codon:yes stop_codon:yes gene_type:complete